jgi:O-antigen ligase
MTNAAKMRKLVELSFKIKSGTALIFSIFAVIIGFSVTIIPYVYIVIAMLFPLIVWKTWSTPAFGAVLCLAILLGLGQQFMPEFSIGVGSIKVHEILIFLVIISLLTKIKNYRNISRNFVKDLWIVWFFFGMTIFGAMNGFLFNGALVKSVLQEIRVQYCWLMAPIVYIIMHSEDEKNKFTTYLYYFGLMMAIISVLQYVTGIQILGRARVESLNTLNEVNTGVVRSIIGGGLYYVILSLFMSINKTRLRSVSSIVYVAMSFVCLLAIVVSFGRAIWFAFIVAYFIFNYLKFGVGVLVKNIIFLAIVFASLWLLGNVLYPNITSAVVERFASVRNEGFHNSSLGWRIEESNYAYEALLKSPFSGIGIGTYYKPIIELGDESTTEMMRRYIHNSYLGLWLKFGILGPIVAVIFSISIIISSLKNISSKIVISTVENSLFYIATFVTFLVPILVSITQPEWLSDGGIAFISVALGILMGMPNSIKPKQYIQSI